MLLEVVDISRGIEQSLDVRRRVRKPEPPFPSSIGAAHIHRILNGR
jgi:hypothetical protein